MKLSSATFLCDETDEVLAALAIESDHKPKPKLIRFPTCQCKGAAQHNASKYTEVWGMQFQASYLPTTTKDGFSCDFCNHAVFWDKKAA